MSKSIGQNRILQEMKSMVKEKPENLFAQPLENDMFIWHFTILGPENTDFHEGIYHGQIVLPFEYPFKPPDIYFFTKNGRFEDKTKICLTITQYHPQQWNAAWTIRTMLEAVISLFNEHVPGVGYIEASSDTRQHLAKQSQNYACEKCGPIKNILKIRKPMQVVLPSILPKPMAFATHDSRKLSQAMLFSSETNKQNSEQVKKPDQTNQPQQTQDKPVFTHKMHPIPEVVQDKDMKQIPAQQNKGKKSIFDAVKNNLRLLQWAQINSKFTRRTQ